MSEPSKINFVICTYNNAGPLDRALNCLAAQRGVPLEQWSVIVVNNNCTDQTDQIVRNHQRTGRLPGLTMVMEPRQGISFARRLGLLSAQAEWIIFVDDDNYLEPDWLQMFLRFLEAHPESSMVTGKIELEWESTPSDAVRQTSQAFVERDWGNAPIRLPARGCLLPGTGGLALRRDAILKSSWMDHAILSGRIGRRLSSGEDTELVIRMLKEGAVLWYCPDLKMKHFVASRRMEMRYIARLMRGCTRSGAVLDAINLGPAAGPKWLGKRLLANTGYLLRRTLAWLVYDVLIKRRLWTKRYVQVFEAIGQIESVFMLLRLKMRGVRFE